MIPGVIAAQRIVPARANIAGEILASLISWWDFEQATGSSFTDSHGSNPLTPRFDAGAMTTASGKTGRAMEVSVDSELAYAATAAPFSFGNQSFTLFFWHYRSAADNPGAGVTKWLAGRWYSALGATQRSYAVAVIGGSPDLYRAFINSDGTSATTVTVDGPEYVQSSAGWDLIATGYDAANDQLFLIVNGAKTVVTQTAGAFAGATAKLAFGAQVSAGFDVTTAGLGAYDAAGVLSSAITPAQYALLYNSGAGINYQGLQSLAA